MKLKTHQVFYNNNKIIHQYKCKKTKDYKLIFKQLKRKLKKKQSKKNRHKNIFNNYKFKNNNHYKKDKNLNKII